MKVVNSCDKCRCSPAWSRGVVAIDGNTRDVLKNGYTNIKMRFGLNTMLCEACFGKLIDSIRDIMGGRS